jgi:hypothetical protein
MADMLSSLLPRAVRSYMLALALEEPFAVPRFPGASVFRALRDLLVAVPCVPRLVILALASKTVAHRPAPRVTLNPRVLWRVLVPLRAMRLLLVWQATLLRCVAHVRGAGAQEQVSWIAARRVIARMADEQSGSNRTVRELPRNTTSTATYTAPRKLSVAIAVGARSPDPASVTLLDMRPKIVSSDVLPHGWKLTLSSSLLYGEVALC